MVDGKLKTYRLYTDTWDKQDHFIFGIKVGGSTHQKDPMDTSDIFIGNWRWLSMLVIAIAPN